MSGVPSPQSILLAEKLRKRAADCRIAGAVFYDLPPLAQTALYGIAAELDDAVGLVEQLEDYERADQAWQRNYDLVVEQKKRILEQHEALLAERDDDDRPHLLPRRELWARVRSAEEQHEVIRQNCLDAEGNYLKVFDENKRLLEQHAALRRTLEQIAGNHGRCDAGHVRIAREALGD